MENLETKVKIQMQKWAEEAQVLIQRTPPSQLYASIAVVVFTVLLLVFSNLLYFKLCTFFNCWLTMKWNWKAFLLSVLLIDVFVSWEMANELNYYYSIYSSECRFWIITFAIRYCNKKLSDVIMLFTLFFFSFFFVEVGMLDM